jgi:hypothetical protein
VDGSFLDNTSSTVCPTTKPWTGTSDKLASNRIVLNRNMEVVFNEYWMEQGVWGSEWNVTSVRRMKYVRGVVPKWKPLISEYSRFHEGDRAHGWLKPKSASLGIAEAARLVRGRRNPVFRDPGGARVPHARAFRKKRRKGLHPERDASRKPGIERCRPARSAGEGAGPAAGKTQETRGQILGRVTDHDDDQETPNTQLSILSYPDKSEIVFEVRA